MKRSTSLTFLASLVALGRRGASADDLIPMRAVGSSNDGFKAMYYGARSGLFARYGLAVEIIPVNNGAAAAAALIGGGADVAMANILTLIQAHAKGIPMRMIAPNFLATSDRPTTAVLVLKDSPYKSGADLIGKTLASPGLNDIASVGAKAWMDQTGGDSKATKYIEAPTSATVSYLEQGRADAVASIEPAVSQAMASGKLRVLADPLATLGKRVQVGSYVVMEPALAKRFDAFSRLAKGLHDASLYTNTHLAETVDLVASYSGTSPDAIAGSNRVIDPEYCDVRLVQPVIDALAKYGAIDQSFPAADIISSAALKPPR
jgi:NitT/TauT family transport system substrate-binding protein